METAIQKMKRCRLEACSESVLYLSYTQHKVVTVVLWNLPGYTGRGGG